MKCWFVCSFYLFFKSGSMETHLALSAVLAGREYLTSQIALLFFLLGAQLLSVAMQPHPPNCQVQGHIPLLSPPPFSKKRREARGTLYLK